MDTVEQSDMTPSSPGALPSRQRSAPVEHRIGVDQGVLDTITSAMSGVQAGGWQPSIIEPTTRTPKTEPDVPVQPEPADDAPSAPAEQASPALPTRRTKAAPIAHQIKVGQGLLDAVSASINAVELTGWQPPIIEAAPLVKPLVAQKTPPSRVKTANGSEALATSHRAGLQIAELNLRGSMAPLRPVTGPWRGAVNEVFDWRAEIWGTPKYLPVIREVGDIRSVMEEPRFDLWARPVTDPSDPTAVPVRVGGSSSESAVLNLATRRAATSRIRLRNAYILLGLLGFLGMHHLYLNRLLHTMLYVVVLLMGVSAHSSGVGWNAFLPVVLLMAVDAVLMPRHEQNSTGSLWGI